MNRAWGEPEASLRRASSSSARCVRAVCAAALLAASGAASGLAPVSGLARTPADPKTKSAADFAAQRLLLAAVKAGERLVAAGQFGNILLSDDQGQTWRKAQNPTDITLTDLFFPSPRTGFAVGHDTAILKTTDGGETWKLVYKDPEHEDPVALMRSLTNADGDSCAKQPEPDGCQLPFLGVYFRDETHGIAVGAFSLVMETRDGGQNWNWRPLAPGNEDDLHLNDLFAGADGALYAPSEFGIVYKSTDQGATFQPIQTPYEGSFWGGLALDDGAVLIHGMRGNAFRSADNGQNWQKVPTGNDQSFAGSARLASGEIVMTGLSGAVARSADNARSFTSINRADRLGNAAIAEGADGELLLFGAGGIRRQPLAEIPPAP